jgi:hypothetical protein
VVAAAIDIDEGPSHGPLVSPEITEAYEAAAQCNSAANSLHAPAAVSSDPHPGPEYIRPELISGGNAAKSIYHPLAASPLVAIAFAALVAAYEPALVRRVVANSS